MKFKLFFIIPVLCLSGCSWFSFSSNIDPDNFTEYYRAAGIEQYTKADLDKFDSYEDLGDIEGISCQVTEKDAEPVEALARRYLLESAADLGANAVIMGKCIELENTLHCLKEYTCYARALKVKQ